MPWASAQTGGMEAKKSSRKTGCFFCTRDRPQWPNAESLLGSSRAFGVTVAEALHAATHVVHAFLRAGVEGVRLAGGVQLEERQFAAVFHRDHFFGVGAGTGHELEAVGHVLEANFAVVGVNAVFHDVFLEVRCASRSETIPLYLVAIYIASDYSPEIRP